MSYCAAQLIRIPINRENLIETLSSENELKDTDVELFAKAEIRSAENKILHVAVFNIV